MLELIFQHILRHKDNQLRVNAGQSIFNYLINSNDDDVNIALSDTIYAIMIKYINL